MEIEYILSTNDWGAFVTPLTEKKPRTDRVTRRYASLKGRIFLLLLVALLVLIGEKKHEKYAFFDLAGSFLLGFVAGNAAVLIELRISEKMLVVSDERDEVDERNRRVFHEKKARIDPEGLSIISPTEQTKIAWRGICQIDATDQGAMFWTTTKSGYPIPRRAFRDQPHFEEFIALARHYKQGPKSTGIITSLPPDPTAITRQDAP